MNLLAPNETKLEGEWVTADDQITSNDACRRIDWLVTEVLKLIRVDRTTWEKLFQDPKDSRYWLLYYPYSEMHGGGPPSLMEISYQDAEARFKAKR